jgi:hypothetical protein
MHGGKHIGASQVLAQNRPTALDAQADESGTEMRAKHIAWACIALLWVLAGCNDRAPVNTTETPAQRYDAAKALFEKASREFHIPSAEARGAVRVTLEEQAAAIYQRVAGEYPDQPGWAAQALRSLANIRASQTNVNGAVKLYSEVAQKFPRQDFEVLMAWKSAGDLLSDFGKPADARLFYERLITRFDRTNALPIVESVVRGAKMRMTGASLPAGDS